MIEDSVTIIVLGNKYNRAIYDTKKMAAIFQSSALMDDGEKPGSNNEDLSSDEKQDSTIANKNDSLSIKKNAEINSMEKKKKWENRILTG